MQCVIDSNNVQEFLGVMISELDEKQRRHMLAKLFEIVGRDNATELNKMTVSPQRILSRIRAKSKTP